MSIYIILLLAFGLFELLGAYVDIKHADEHYIRTRGLRARDNVVTIIVLTVLIAGSHGVFG